MNRKQKIIISITGIILILSLLIGLTYGYYLTKIQGNSSDKSISVNLANLELTYNDGNGLIEAKNIIPGQTIATKTFSVKNTGNAKINNYVIYLDSVINTFQDKSDLNLTLSCTSDVGNCNGTNIEYPSTNKILITNDIEVNETQSYELTVEFIETNDDQSDNMNKEMSGNIILKDIKSTGSNIENVTGTNEQVVENAKLLSNYRIYGNSIQETRSGKNLYNINKIPVSVSNIKRQNNGYYTSSSSSIRFFTYQTLENYIGKTVTASFDLTTSEDGTFEIYAYQSNGIGIKFTKIYKEMKANVSEKIVITGEVVKLGTNENYTKGEIIVYKNGYTGSYTLNNLQIELGSMATEYEPYGTMPSPDYPSEIKSVGNLVTDASDANYGKYKIPIKVTGKNLLNSSLWKNSLTQNGLTIQYLEDEDCFLLNGTTTKTAEYYRKYINLKVDKTKTYSISTKYVSGTIDKSGSNKYSVAYFSKNDTINNVTNWKEIKLEENDTNSPNKSIDTSYITSMWFYINDGITFNNYKVKIQLEEGETATEYEPHQEEITNIYLNEPLRKIGDYSDYIDFKSGKVVRKITSNIITNSTTYIPKKNDTVCWFSIDSSNKHIIDINVLSSMFKSIQKTWWSNEESILSHKINSSGIYFALKWSRLGLIYDGKNVYKTEDTTKTNPITDAELSNLASKFILTNFSENDRTIYYPNLNQTEEIISLPNINLNSTTNYINIDTNIPPSDVILEIIK